MRPNEVKIQNEKISELLTYIITNNITELNKLIYAGVKLVCEKNRGSSKEHKQKFKTLMEN